ncbi:MAG: hypothetical protein ACOC91_03190, partial [bacterium]
ITLSGHSVSAVSINESAAAILRIDDNGYMYSKKNNDPYVQIDSETDWIRPTSEAPGLYEVRYTDHSGDPINGTENSWYSLTSGAEFWINRTSPGKNSATFRLEIRRDGGPVLASGFYSLSAEYVEETLE